MYSVAKIIPSSQTEEFVIEIWLEGFGLFLWRLLEIKVSLCAYLLEDKRFLSSDMSICRTVCE